MKRIIVTFVVMLVAVLQIDGQSLNVGSYNVRYKGEGDSLNGNGWNRRMPVICSQVRFHDFDIFGTQEVLYPQLNDMAATLPEYGYIGEGRDGGTKGEYNVIFYKKNRFKLLDSGTFWLSPTDTAHPNVGWDAALTRVCTWAVFKDQDSGKTIRFFNTHFDHVGVEARRESAKMILRKIDEMTKGKKGAVILTGDFNVDQTNESYKLLASSPELKDCYESATFRHAQNGTFNSFNVNSFTDKRIDHIFVSRYGKVTRYGILTEFYWTPVEGAEATPAPGGPRELRTMKYTPRTPSDHYAIMAHIDF